MKYGLWDMLDSCWIGSATGPNEYDVKEKAMLAACVANARVETRRRFVVKPLPEPPFRKKDEITPSLSGAEAVRRLEKHGEPLP